MASKSKKKKSKAVRHPKSAERLLMEEEISLWEERMWEYEQAHPDAIYSEKYYKIQKHLTAIHMSRGRTKVEYARYAKRFHNIRGGELEKMFVNIPKKTETEELPPSVKMKDLPSIKVGDVYDFEPEAEALPYYTTIVDEWYEYLSRKNVKKSTDIVARIKQMLDNLVSEFGKEIVGQILMLEQDKLPNLNSKIDYEADLQRFPHVVLNIMNKYAQRSTNKDIILPKLKAITTDLNEKLDEITQEGIGNEGQ